MIEYLAEKDRIAFIAAARPGTVSGFVEATIRPFAECCDTRPVGYIEGWYVDADVRQRGVGRRLVLAAERWARGEGCSEMGSDCLVENQTSLFAHRAIGYEEREHLIHFRKWLRSPRRR
jgi:aminoglycoside 6'-N-acetyltransferase I